MDKEIKEQYSQLSYALHLAKKKQSHINAIQRIDEELKSLNDPLRDFDKSVSELKKLVNKKNTDKHTKAKVGIFLETALNRIKELESLEPNMRQKETE